MRKLLSIIALSLSASLLPALEPSEVLDIASQPHDRSGLNPALGIYPDVRSYEMEVTIEFTGKPPYNTSGVMVDEKVVNGEYVVSEFEIPINPPLKITVVVEYMEDLGIYKKWVLNHQTKKVTSGTGIGDVKTGTMSWQMVNEEGANVLTLEHHNHERSIWRELYTKDGEVSHQLHGTAVAQP